MSITSMRSMICDRLKYRDSDATLVLGTKALQRLITEELEDGIEFLEKDPRVAVSSTLSNPWDHLLKHETLFGCPLMVIDYDEEAVDVIQSSSCAKRLDTGRTRAHIDSVLRVTEALRDIYLASCAAARSRVAPEETQQ